MKSKFPTSTVQSQTGYMLVFVASALLGIGAIGLQLNVHVVPVFNQAKLAPSLDAAKLALVSYAVNYIDLYGVQGAGPGHFPCPDTDGRHVHVGGQSSMATQAYSKDGPNPPCAAQHVVTGKLPRHVSVKRGRYIFHNEPYQRYNYAIDARFVNNPVNRVVNASSKGALQYAHRNDVIAVVSMPLENELPWLSLTQAELKKRLSKSRSSRVITINDIRVPMMRRVGHWYIAQLNYALKETAQLVGCTYGLENKSNANGLCVQQKLAQSQSCGLSGLSLSMHWLLIGTPQLAKGVGLGAGAFSEEQCTAYQHALNVEMQIFQWVPLQRHWFARNKWYEYIRFQFSQQCRENMDELCTPTLLPISSKDKFITIEIAANTLLGAR